MITSSVPIPSSFRVLTGHPISSFGENVPASFILPSMALPGPTAPFSRAIPVQHKFASIVRPWARTRVWMSQSMAV